MLHDISTPCKSPPDDGGESGSYSDTHKSAGALPVRRFANRARYQWRVAHGDPHRSASRLGIVLEGRVMDSIGNSSNGDAKALAAQKWLGYGRWAARHWFVGMEPGGDEDPRVYTTWRDLGAPELLDLREHSVACDDMRRLVETHRCNERGCN
jgi:hypothetical protein